MVDFKGKIIYVLCLVLLSIFGITIGYFKTVKLSEVEINNISAFEYAKEYVFGTKPHSTVTASANVSSITVNYVDYYTVCKDEVITSKTVNGMTMDGVKEQERIYQEENGLLYEIFSETEDSVTYKRKVKGNCPNHFYVIYEQNRRSKSDVKGAECQHYS